MMTEDGRPKTGEMSDPRSPVSVAGCWREIAESMVHRAKRKYNIRWRCIHSRCAVPILYFNREDVDPPLFVSPKQFCSFYNSENSDSDK